MAQKKTSKAIFNGLEAGMRLFKWTVLLLVILFWFSGITNIQTGNVGMVMRFGRLQGHTLDEQIRKSGKVLALPYPIDEVIQVPEMKEGELKINDIFKSLKDETASIDTIDPLLEGYALTGDMNVVQAQIVVKYKVVDPIAYRLGTINPEFFLRDIILASFTQTVALWEIDDVLRLQRSPVKDGQDQLEAELAEAASTASLVSGAGSAVAADSANSAVAADSGHDAWISEDGFQASELSADKISLKEQVLKLARKRLEPLNLGMEIIGLEFREIHPPRHVIQDFQYVHDAKIEIGKMLEQAKMFANQTVSEAKTEMDTLVQEANQRSEKLLSETEAVSKMFTPTCDEYKKNPNLVLQRVYLETVERIFNSPGCKVQFLPPETKAFLSDEGMSGESASAESAVGPAPGMPMARPQQSLPLTL